MQELIDPLEVKLNQLLDTEKLQEDQAVEIKHLKDKQSELYRKCIKIEHENNHLKRRLECLESTMLEGNIIMHGLREDEWELDSNRKERIYHAIASTVDAEDRRARLDIARSIPIRSSRRLGKYKTGKSRPISIAFEKKSHADILFKSKSWLPRGVYIDREYTQEVENKRKLLHPILKLARSIEKYRGKCKLEDNRLVILGTTYTVDDLHKLPNNLSGFHASSKTDTNNNVIAFFGELSPFSNFHKSPFQHGRQEYHCSEQFVQEQKALLFNDTKTAESIMISMTALECKEKGKEIKGYKEEIWRRKAEDMLTRNTSQI